MTPLIRFALGFMLVFTSLFLIALVLIQRGRGGGLAGAFGGMGGQSAFGTKAGDVFTKITVVVAACWILLCILAINVLGRRDSLFSPGLGGMAGQNVAPQTTPAAGAPPAAATGGTAAIPAAAATDAPAGQPAGSAAPATSSAPAPDAAAPASQSPPAPENPAAAPAEK
ncbi:MAG: preprotein translocase subunit SecG [Pirellulales bacterium]|jgi:preprotein translocase subunit SecG